MWCTIQQSGLGAFAEVLLRERPSAMPIIETIVAQRAEEATFQWLLRDVAVRAPHYSLSDLADLDHQVEAHLDGLRIAGGEGWPFSADGLKHEESG
jgi:hypothetical protein